MRHYVTGLSRNREVIFETRLPARGHGIALRADQREAVIFARRPGNFALVFDIGSGVAKRWLRCPTGRHFYGHGTFSKEGRYLFSTENNFECGRGMIGVWDAKQAYRRVKEWPSGGIGPHEVGLSKDNRSLLVANGGVSTHPDTGRQKLNIGTMKPALTCIDIGSGRILESHGFDESRHQLLSIRHLAMGKSGAVCMALQDQGPADDLQPLFALLRPHSSRLELLESPNPVTRRLQGYGGAVAVDPTGRIAAMSAPRGDLITLWDVRGARYLDAVELVDGCGIARTESPGRFVATSGTGTIAEIGYPRHHLNFDVFAANRRWDNHLFQIPTPGYRAADMG